MLLTLPEYGNKMNYVRKEGGDGKNEEEGVPRVYPAGGNLGNALETPESALHFFTLRYNTISEQSVQGSVADMVSYSNKTDQFGSLLSGVSGVDSSAFQKRPLKDAKAPDAAADRRYPSSQRQTHPSSSFDSMSDMSRGQSNSQQKLEPSAQRSSPTPSASVAQSNKHSYNASSKATSTQFDSIFGDLSSSQQSR